MPIWSTIPRAEGGFSAVTYEVHVHVVVAQRACKIKKKLSYSKAPPTFSPSAQALESSSASTPHPLQEVSSARSAPPAHYCGW